MRAGHAGTQHSALSNRPIAGRRVWVGRAGLYVRACDGCWKARGRGRSAEVRPGPDRDPGLGVGTAESHFGLGGAEISGVRSGGSCVAERAARPGNGLPAS